MCGIAGYYTGSREEELNEHLLLSMAERMRHRGPDNQGAWISKDRICGLSHARLSVLDLTALANQPMLSQTDRFAVVFNGEIYNFQQLRAQLEADGTKFRSTGDTEVLVACIEKYGPTATCKQLNGMFAIAVYDTKEKRLYLTRDRTGEKPLYYGEIGHTHYFASDLNALKAIPGIRLQIDPAALALFFTHNYIPAPYCIFKGFRKLLPGHVVELSLREHKVNKSIETYWSIEGLYKNANGSEQHDTAGEGELFTELESLIEDSVKRQMISDVPLGAFLSGGIDSSMIVALMQKFSSKAVKTFTIGFDDPVFNEAPIAKVVAESLGTDHTEVVLTGNEILDLIPNVADIYSEPFADPSQLPTYLVTKLAREQVTVALSGDGGDELFAGYDRYPTAMAYFNGSSKTLARPRKSTIDRLVKTFGHCDTVLNPLITALRGKTTCLSMLRLGDRMLKRHSNSLKDIYQVIVEYWPLGYISNINGADFTDYVFNDDQLMHGMEDSVKKLQLLDMLTYLPDDILCKVDRAAMANSLETRIPLLDHRIVELSTKFPVDCLYRDQQSKWPLRKILYKYLPQEIYQRPKRGFGVPLSIWLKSNLREWADDLLAPNKLNSTGMLSTHYITQIWNIHKNTDKDMSFYLWGVITFQMWYERWKNYIET